MLRRFGAIRTRSTPESERDAAAATLLFRRLLETVNMRSSPNVVLKHQNCGHTVTNSKSHVLF